METSIEKIVRKLSSLSEVKILEVLDFVEFLTWNKEHLTLPPLENDDIRENGEFEAIADHLADEFQLYFGTTVPALSDHAASRAGIYQEHP